MQITLRKVGKTPLNFEKSVENITLKGFLQYDKESLILLDATLYGTIVTDCALCGEEFNLEVNEELQFFVSDGVFIDKESSNIDVVETSNGVLDIDDLIHSELELIKSDYNCCQQCKNKDGDFSLN